MDEAETSLGLATPGVEGVQESDTEVADIGDQSGQTTDQGTADHGDQTTEDDKSTESESEEVEFDGKKYNVPRELKDALMRNVDYTRKTTELAEQRRALETQQQSFQQAAQLHQSNLSDYAQIMAVDAQLKQFEGVNWSQLSQQDPVQAQQAFFQFSQLKDLRGNLANILQQKERTVLESQQHDAARRIEEGNAILAREIKGWSPQLASQLREFAAAKLGFQPNEIAQVTPSIVKAIHQAWIAEQIVAKASPPPKPKAQIAKPAGQLPTGKSTVKKDPSDMTDAEFTEWRRKTIKNRSK